MLTSIKGRSVIVTGGSKGIGRGIARVFAAQGAKVMIAARGREAADEVVAELRAAGGTAEAVACAVADRDSVQAMVEAVRIPVTVKTRIGADDFDSYDWLCGFVGQLRSAGCTTFIVHARKAWLKGLSPKENREVPPLDHSRVYRLKRDFPDLHIVLNGGIHQWSEVRRHLQYVDGVMIGRHGYQEPQWWATLDQDFFGCSLPPLTGVDLLVRCRPYVQAHLESGRRLYDIVRHLVGLYRRLPSASAFRRFIACNCSERRADLKIYDTLIEIAHHLEGGNSPWKVA